MDFYVILHIFCVEVICVNRILLDVSLYLMPYAYKPVSLVYPHGDPGSLRVPLVWVDNLTLRVYTVHHTLAVLRFPCFSNGLTFSEFGHFLRLSPFYQADWLFSLTLLCEVDIVCFNMVFLWIFLSQRLFLGFPPLDLTLYPGDP